MILQMDPSKIKIHHEPTERDVKRQMTRLLQEGQIEPILLHKDNSPDLKSWVYAEAQVVAAIRLEWETVLVTYKEH